MGFINRSKRNSKVSSAILKWQYFIRCDQRAFCNHMQLIAILCKSNLAYAWMCHHIDINDEKDKRKCPEQEQQNKQQLKTKM